MAAGVAAGLAVGLAVGLAAGLAAGMRAMSVNPSYSYSTTVAEATAVAPTAARFMGGPF